MRPFRGRPTQHRDGHMSDDNNRYRRSGLDRRGWRPMPKVPFVDSDGNLVSHDRRKTPDRRRDRTQPSKDTGHE